MTLIFNSRSSNKKEVGSGLFPRHGEGQQLKVKVRVDGGRLEVVNKDRQQVFQTSSSLSQQQRHYRFLGVWYKDVSGLRRISGQKVEFTETKPRSMTPLEATLGRESKIKGQISGT